MTMKSDNSLKDLIHSINQAIDQGTVDENYSFWEDYCRKEYNISSYTLQLLVKHCLAHANDSKSSNSIPDEISPSLIDTSNKKTVYKDRIIEKKGKGTTESAKLLNWVLGLVVLIVFIFVIFTISLNKKISRKQNEIENIRNQNWQKIQEIDVLKSKMKSLESFVDTLESLSFIVGSSSKKTTSTYYDQWRMWLEAKTPVNIKSFCVKPNISGKIKIYLYTENNQYVDDYEISVSGGQFNRIHPNFVIKKAGRYYMCIYPSNGISLQYHSSSNYEYQNFLQGALQIIGCSNYVTNSKNPEQMRRDYYMYFYDIVYSIFGDE